MTLKIKRLTLQFDLCSEAWYMPVTYFRLAITGYNPLIRKKYPQDVFFVFDLVVFGFNIAFGIFKD